MAWKNLKCFQLKYCIELKGSFKSGGICADISSTFSFLHQCFTLSALVTTASKVQPYRLEVTEPWQGKKRSPLARCDLSLQTDKSQSACCLFLRQYLIPGMLLSTLMCSLYIVWWSTYIVLKQKYIAYFSLKLFLLLMCWGKKYTFLFGFSKSFSEFHWSEKTLFVHVK